MATTAIFDRDLRRVVIASLIGATIEWYDFFLYGTVAGIVFNKLFFPAQDPLISILLAYTTFAVGFVARPLGGVIFGHFGDRIGRKSMLILTLMIMGIATVLIGLLPTYQQIGIAAPIILLVLRVLQGIGLGGEWGGAVLMTYEYATEDKRGLFASLPQIGLSIGLCLSAGHRDLFDRGERKSALVSLRLCAARSAACGAAIQSRASEPSRMPPAAARRAAA